MLKRQMRIVRQRPWLRVAISVGFILLLSITLVGLHVRAYPKLSPIDELQHIDALYRASHGEIVRRGQLVGQEAMGEEACRGIDALFRPPPCGGPYQPSRFQEAGINTADIHPPTYYFATVGVADLLRAVGLASNLVDAGRLVGALWLGLGLMACWWLAGLIGAGFAARAVVVVLLSSTPQVLHSSATINPDATAILAGALMLISVLAWEGQSRWFAAMPVSAALAVLLNATNVVGVLAAAAYLLVRWWTHRQVTGGARPGDARGAASHLYAAGALLAGALVAEAAWLLVRRAIALPNPPTAPMTQQFSVSFLSPTQVGSQVAAFLTPISHPPTPVFFGHPSVLAVVALFGALLIAGCFGCAMFAARLGTVESLATAGTGVMVTGGPILVITLFLTQRIFVPVPSRYGLSLMPLLVSVLARSLRSSWWLVPAAVLAVASLIVTVVALVGAT